ncbi:MAG: CDP-alcohol phosphatidyltransferase family protein, partial [Rhodospirillales bacterium]|nr:CDP-alcohol phosphatidyltransferase family protein [Rhodospirillales bacterium]
MFDPVLRRLIDPPLNRAGAWLARQGVPANGASLVGLMIGLLAVPALAHGRYDLALLAILFNRLIDGVDGPIARQGKPTPFGGYLDIMCDMAFYAAVPLGFALADAANAVWAAILLASFVCTGASFLGRAVLAAQVGEANDGKRGRKSFFHAAGLIEGSETIAAFVLFCLLPGGFPWLAGLFA